MDQHTFDDVVDRLHANPDLDGVPFEVVESEDGLHLRLAGETLATVPADLEERRAQRADLERRYGISLVEAEDLDGAPADALEKWLYYAAGFGDSIDPVTAWETRRYEARVPAMGRVVTERVRDRLAAPFVGVDRVGESIVEALSFDVTREVMTRESEWTGTPVEASAGYYLDVGIDLEAVDDELLVFRLDDQLKPLSEDRRADAERLVPPRCIVLVADALTVRWDGDLTEETASGVEIWLDHAGEAFVGGALDRPQPGERTFAEGMVAVSERLDTPHELAVAWREAYVRREDQS